MITWCDLAKRHRMTQVFLSRLRSLSVSTHSFPTAPPPGPHLLLWPCARQQTQVTGFVCMDAQSCRWMHKYLYDCDSAVIFGFLHINKISCWLSSIVHRCWRKANPECQKGMALLFSTYMHPLSRACRGKSRRKASWWVDMNIHGFAKGTGSDE